MKYNLIKTLLFVCLVFAFSTCKKVQYPENDKKVRKPQRYEKYIMRGFITSYKVNGVDSLPLFSADRLKWFSGSFSLWWDNKEDSRRRSVQNHSVLLEYEWNSNYKYIYIRYYPDTSSLKNIFIENGLNWEILKLETSTTTVDFPFKIRSTFNGNNYEIQFN